MGLGVSYQLSVISYQLSVISSLRKLPTPHTPPMSGGSHPTPHTLSPGKTFCRKPQLVNPIPARKSWPNPLNW
ncbi:MAG: hypothetical protein ACKPIF_26820, partial [Microcystis panniformis]